MSRSRLLLPLILIILLGFSLRIHRLAAVPLRGDEAFSALFWADLPLAQSLSSIAPLDPHPPLAFILIRLWRHLIAAIEPVFALRYLPALGNIIGAAAIFALGWRLSGRRAVGLLAALCWAMHPYAIWHSQDFRHYAIWSGLSVTSLWLGLRVIQLQRRGDWLLYGAAATAAALMFYADIFMIAALSAFAVLSCRSDRRFLVRFLALQAGIALLVFSSFAILQARVFVSGDYSGNLQAFAAPDLFTRFVPVLLLGETFPWNPPIVGVILTAVLVLAAALIFAASRQQFTFLILLAVTPLFCLALIAQRLSIFNPRYVLAAAPAFALILILGSYHAAGFARRAHDIWRSVLALLLLLPWFALAAGSIHAYFNDPAFRKAPAWDELGEFLNARVTASDLVIQQSVDPAFAYYYHGAASETALPASSAQSPEEIAAELSRHSQAFASIYIVSRAQAGWPNANVVVDWMSGNLQEVLRTDTAGLPVRQYMPWRVADPGDEIARFDDIVALSAVEVADARLPTGELLLWLYWKPLARAPQSLKSFVHLYDRAKPAAGATLRSQDDQYPLDGRLDSTNWPVGEVFREIYYLPVEALEAGEYQLHIGWYDPLSGERLMTDGDADTFYAASYRAM